MKVFKFFAVCALVMAMTASCYSVPSVEKQPEGITKADVDSASYALGVYYGQMIVIGVFALCFAMATVDFLRGGAVD